MPEFATLQQNAKKMSGTLSRHFMSQQGCLSFFSAIVPNNSALDDACTITMLANSLDDSNDRKLRIYLDRMFNHPVMTVQEFEDFKTRVLLGIYIFKWANYNSSLVYYINKPLIELFQIGLEIQTLAELDEQMMNSSLKALSHYCSYVYENRYKQMFEDINNSLGDTIQLEIHNTLCEINAENSSWYSVYAKIVSTIRNE